MSQQEVWVQPGTKVVPWTIVTALIHVRWPLSCVGLSRSLACPNSNCSDSRAASPKDSLATVTRLSPAGVREGAVHGAVALLTQLLAGGLRTLPVPPASWTSTLYCTMYVRAKGSNAASNTRTGRTLARTFWPRRLLGRLGK